METAEQQKTKLIDSVAERVGAEAGEAGERFARLLYAHAAPVDILGEEAENLAGSALSLWRFAEERPPGAPKIRVYNPRPEKDGWDSAHTAIEIVNDDMPFLVDSVVAQLRILETEVKRLFHPIVSLQRGADGRAAGFCETGENGPGCVRESVMQVCIVVQPEARHEVIRRQLESVLADVRLAVDDWQAMRGRCWAIVGDLEKNPPPLLQRRDIQEGVAFLEWLADNHFTFLGYREYSFEGEGETAVARVLIETGLGLLRNEQFAVFDGLRNLGTLPEDVRHFLRQPQLLLITKSNRLATVHRAVPMDTIAIKCFDAQGHVTGRAAVHRPLHLDRLLAQPAHDPDPAPEGRALVRARRLPPGQPRRQGPVQHPGDLPARRAVPDHRGRAVPDRNGHPAAPAAAADRPVRPPRSLRALRLLPGLRAARPLRHRPGAAVPATSWPAPGGKALGHLAGLHDGRGAGAGALPGRHHARGRSPTSTRSTSSGSSPRRRAPGTTA